MKKATSHHGKRARAGGVKKRGGAKHYRPNPPNARKGREEGVRRLQSAPPGFEFRGNRVLVPTSMQAPVPVSKIARGLENARSSIEQALDSALRAFGGPFEVKEIKFVASFTAQGQFLGIGVGGATSMEITVRPSGHDE